MGSGAQRARSRLRRVSEFGRRDRAAGIALSAATVAAMVWANAASASYRHFWGSVPDLPGPLHLGFSLREWVEQGVMTGFFALVGLEIRREISAGELRSWRRASVPLVAAVVGMAVPAGIYALIVRGSPGGRGWGIPMATDVAFAVGALALVGGKRPPRLRVFLMTLAVADDIASVVLLVVFYNVGLEAVWVSVGLAAIAAMAVVESLEPAWGRAELLLGCLAWWALAHGGVEAAVVGVAIGAVALPSRSPETGERRGPRVWEERITPWVNLGVLPVFALADAGLRLAGIDFSSAATLTVFSAVVLARLIGKPLGITIAVSALRRIPSGRYDARIAGRDVVGIGALAGMGFTVPVLIVHAALPAGPLADSAILGLLCATVFAAVGGAVVLKR